MHFHIQFLYIKHCSLHSIKLFLGWYETIEPNKVTYYKSKSSDLGPLFFLQNCSCPTYSFIVIKTGRRC